MLPKKHCFNVLVTPVLQTENNILLYVLCVVFVLKLDKELGSDPVHGCQKLYRCWNICQTVVDIEFLGTKTFVMPECNCGLVKGHLAYHAKDNLWTLVEFA